MLLKTTLSDIEVEQQDIDVMKEFHVPKYKEPFLIWLVDQFSIKVKDSNEELIVATTRLETMLGDRYCCNQFKRFIDIVIQQIRKFIHFATRLIKVIADDQLINQLITYLIQVHVKQHLKMIQTIINVDYVRNQNLFLFLLKMVIQLKWCIICWNGKI